jgi:hypothetical protein
VLAGCIVARHDADQFVVAGPAEAGTPLTTLAGATTMANWYIVAPVFFTSKLTLPACAELAGDLIHMSPRVTAMPPFPAGGRRGLR